MTTATAHAAAAREFKSNDGNAWRQHYPSRDCNLNPAPFTAKLTVGLIQPFKPARMVQNKINLVSTPRQRPKDTTGNLVFFKESLYLISPMRESKLGSSGVQKERINRTRST